jgi:uncharacterized protein
MSDTALVIMARYPEEGRLKTRLAAGLGTAATLALYQAFLTDLARRFAGGDCDLHWAYTPAAADFDTRVARLADVDAALWSCFAQQGDELAERLYYAFCMTSARRFHKTVLIGSDSPQICPVVIAQARQELNNVDVVLGPSEDGGYYLIAMREPHDVFRGIPMSTEHVLRMTLERARSLRLSVRLLEPLLDVDELPDLVRLSHLLQEDQALAPATAAWLASHMPAYCLKETI